MSEASISVTVPDVVNQQQSFESEKCAIAHSTVQDLETVLVETPSYDSGKEAWLTIVGAYVVLDANSIYSQPR